MAACRYSGAYRSVLCSEFQASSHCAGLLLCEGYAPSYPTHVCSAAGRAGVSCCALCVCGQAGTRLISLLERASERVRERVWAGVCLCVGGGVDERVRQLSLQMFCTIEGRALLRHWEPSCRVECAERVYLCVRVCWIHVYGRPQGWTTGTSRGAASQRTSALLLGASDWEPPPTFAAPCRPATPRTAAWTGGTRHTAPRRVLPQPWLCRGSTHGRVHRGSS